MTKWIIIGIIAILVIWLVSIYNKLVKLRVGSQNGWAQIETQLQRRYDLIPNLVETVKGYAEHERELLEKVTMARASLGSASSVADKAEADNALSSTIKSLFAVAENYPQLKANENFKELQIELSGTENKIAYARQFYNDTVSELNQSIQMFPSSIIASLFGFKEKDFYEAKAEASEPVKVQF
ncbi:MAG: LemA family protein [Eubacteriales bacterium]|nr:LemA family protein [Eubacteriales bacterium]